MCHRNVRTVTAFDSKLQSCGLCDNMVPALSNTCWDNSTQCPEMANQIGGCHRNGELCRKVRLQLQVILISLTHHAQYPELWTLRRHDEA